MEAGSLWQAMNVTTIELGGSIEQILGKVEQIVG